MYLGFTSFSQTYTKIDPSKSDIPSFEVLKSNANEIIINLQVNAYSFKRVETPNGTSVVVYSPKGGRTYEVGAPDLPLVSTSLLIDDIDMYQSEIVYSDYIELSDIDIAPSKGSLTRNINPDDVPYTYSNVYQEDAFYPENITKLSEPFILRDFRGISLQVFPYQYNPVSKVLRIYTSTVIKLTKTTENLSVNEIQRSKPLQTINGSYNEIYNSIFLNYTENPLKYTPLDEGTPGNILILSKAEYMDAMHDYVTWKTEKGFDVEILDITVAGSNANQIKTYVTDYYNTNGLTYLLFVGDAEDIPVYNADGGDSDNAYAYVVGSDGYADFFVGRFSAQSIANVETQVERTIEYERDLNEEDTWLQNALGSASNEGGGNNGHDGGESDEVHLSYITDDLEAYGYVVTEINQNGGNNAMISSLINNGVGIANYIGHGGDQSWVNTNYTNSEVNALTNESKLLFAFSVACVNGNFEGQTCFAEAWLRANNGGKPTGAIGFLASTINQSWNEPMTGQDEMVDILIDSYDDNIKRSFAGVSMNGMFLMIEEGGQGQAMADTWTVFGDPSLMLRTKTPEEMTISHLDIFNVGAEQFTVNCDVDGALVAISKVDNTNTILLGSAYVEGGIANVSVTPFDSPGTMKITVTAFNKITYQEEIMVIVPEGPYITWQNHTINDAAGNANGLVDYNETIMLNPTAANVGVEDAYDVSCTIDSENQSVNITNASVLFGDITIDNEVTIDNAFTLEIEDGIEDQQSILFNATFEDESSNTWNSTFSIVANAPKLNMAYISIDDSETGNNNGLLDANETVNIIIEAQNLGHANASNGIVTMEIADNATPIISSNNCEGINTEGQETFTFSFIVNDMLSAGAMVSCIFEINLGAYYAELQVSLPVGLQIEDWENGDLTSYAWENDLSLPWVIDNNTAYEGDNSLRSGAVSSSGGESSLTILLDVVTNDEISFMKKVSCEPMDWGMYWDYLAFYIDNQMEDQWAGEIDWTQETYDISEGEHELKWTYAKDGYLSQGDDCAWIDYITLPPHSVSTSILNNTSEVSNIQTSIYPNPAADRANVRIELPNELNASCQVFSISGSLVKTIFDNRNLQKGDNIISFSTSDIPEGYYLILISSKSGQFVHKLSIIR
jgi:hypothetical protein